MILGNTTGTGNILQLQKSSADQFVVTNSGKVTFATGANKPVGTGTITGGTSSTTVSNSLVTAGSIIILTIQDTSNAVIAIKVVSRVAGTSFTVGTADNTNAPAAGIPFSYLLVN